jgi:hypothetical protein
MVLRVDPKSETIVQTVHGRPPRRLQPDFEPLGIAVGAGAVWVTTTIGP